MALNVTPLIVAFIFREEWFFAMTALSFGYKSQFYSINEDGWIVRRTSFAQFARKIIVHQTQKIRHYISNAGGSRPRGCPDGAGLYS